MNPLKRAIAIFILRLFGGDKDKVPYPFLNFVIENSYGGWAGVSIYFSFRQFDYQTKINKFKSAIFSYFLPIIILTVILVGAIQDSGNFFFGFVQNLSAEIILVLLILYILPRILNPKKNYKISLIQEGSYINYYADGKVEITISLINSGQEVYKEKEISWEIFISEDLFDSSDITVVNGNVDKSDELFMTMWKFSGINSSPLFIDQKIQIANLSFNKEVLQDPSHSPCKIYFKIMTINGNVPEFQNVTKDFLGTGVPFERYPRVGELVFYEQYVPDP